MKPAPAFPPADPKLIRLIWIGRLGDLLLATPLFAALRARWPKARISLVTGEKGRAAASLIAEADETLTLAPFYRPLANLRLALTLRAQKADLLIDLNTACSRASTALAALAGAQVKAAFSRGKPDRFFDVLLPAAGETEHMLDRYARLAAALGAPYEPRLRAAVKEIDLAQADLLLKDLRLTGTKVLIHPGNFKKFDNRWPEEKFAALTEHLLGLPGVSVAYLAGPGEETPVKALVARLSRPVPVLGPHPVGLTAALLRRADLVVVNATGTAHLAAAVGTPTFTLLGRYTQTVWMPKPGSGHFSVVSDSWKSCREIPVQAAVAALDGALKALGPSPRR